MMTQLMTKYNAMNEKKMESQMYLLNGSMTIQLRRFKPSHRDMNVISS